MPPSIGPGVGVGVGAALLFATSSAPPHPASASISPIVSNGRMRFSIAGSPAKRSRTGQVGFLQSDVLLLFHIMSRAVPALAPGVDRRGETIVHDPREKCAVKPGISDML